MARSPSPAFLRVFLRFFVPVLLSVAAASAIVYVAMTRVFGDPVEDLARRQATAQIFLLEQFVDKAPRDEWLARLNTVREVAGSHYDLIPLNTAGATLPAAQAAALARGEVVFDLAGKSFLRRVDLDGARYVGSEAEVVRARELPIDVAVALQMEALRFLIVALVLLVPIGVWSRRHWQGVQALGRVADAFGAGNLTARARMPASSSMLPLAERMHAMAGRIDSLLTAQTALLHSVSHELRTPIARLAFGLQLLEDASADPALHKRVQAMAGDVEELNALVSELLAMTRLDSEHALQREPVDLEPLLRACVAALAPSPGSMVSISVELGADLGTLAVDPRLLGRALANLLGNAQRYADARVLLRALRTREGVEISVEDDGPGIPVAEREQVFAPFYRLDRSRDRATGGFGLGLAIARKAVQLHGGSLHVEDGALNGARMVIRLIA
ncbi:ATP-binding protein [Massilia sp. S19_KUP03_FR1]|uniref:ATP-binding protein n=1 Tax=Massilia sp. S19_KUP03_FR1 TaxID=3025503 RepID=UPI002FCCD44C